MKREGLNTFLSSENIEMHCRYLKQLRLRLSIIRKSYPELLCGDQITSFRRITRRIPDEAVTDAKRLIYDIKMHEAYFNSFTTRKEKCQSLKRQFSSEEAFRYEIYDLIKNEDHGYAFAYIDEKGRIKFSLLKEFPVSETPTPLLAIDLCEHAYFYDYLFDKDTYYRRAVESLDLRKIEEALTSS